MKLLLFFLVSCTSVVGGLGTDAGVLVVLLEVLLLAYPSSSKLVEAEMINYGELCTCNISHQFL